MMIDDNLILGFEIGASKIIAILGDLSGKIYRRVYEKTNPVETAKTLIDQLWSLKNNIISDKIYEKVKYISVTCPGLINKGSIVYSPNLPNLLNINLSELLYEKFHKKIYLENDANSQALAQRIFGNEREIKDFVYIAIGSGVGGALIINGELYRGFNGWAGEIGHTVIMVDGPLCGCNRKGCVEALASGFSIARRVREGLSAQVSMLNNVATEKLDAKMVFDAYRAGDEFSKKIIEDTARYMAIAIANVINILDPEAIVLGGGVTKNNDKYIELIRSEVVRELGYYRRDVKIIVASEKLIEKAPIALVKYYNDIL